MLYQVIEDGEITYSDSMVNHDDTYHLVTKGNRQEVTLISAHTSISVNDFTILVDASGGAVTINLPPVAGGQIIHRIYNIKKIDSSVNAVTIDGYGGDTIDGAATKSLSNQYDCLTVHCDGITWYIIGKYTP